MKLSWTFLILKTVDHYNHLIYNINLLDHFWCQQAKNSWLIPKVTFSLEFFSLVSAVLPDKKENNNSSNTRAHTHTDTQTDRQTDRHTDTQTDRLTDRQTDRPTDRQTDRQTGQKDR